MQGVTRLGSDSRKFHYGRHNDKPSMMPPGLRMHCHEGRLWLLASRSADVDQLLDSCSEHTIY
jgi:hypothetical protein